MRNKVALLCGAVAAFVFGSVIQASAALDAAVGTTLTAMGDDLGDLIGLILPIMAIVIGVGLSVWGVPKGVSALKKAFGSGSGR